MKASEILKQTNHRPFEVPKRPWKFYQEWNKALFLHWEVAPELVEPFIPDALELETLNGKCWISLVAFDMNHIGIRSLPKLPHISNFHEINIRTYIKYNKKPSVYFLSMEGSKKSSCKILKAISKFPYEYANMQRTNFSYQSYHPKANNQFDVIYRLETQAFQKDEIDIWLTERYAVFQDYKNRIIEYDVHHLEWPIQSILIKKLEINYPKFNHLLSNKPNRVHYSKGVNVLTWDKKKH